MSATPSFGTAFTPTIGKHSKDILLLNNPTDRKDKLSVFKTFFKRLGPSSRVTTIFSSRSPPCDEASPTAREGEDLNPLREVCEERTTMNALQDATNTVSPPPSMSQTRTTKKLLLKTTMTTPPEDDNPRRELRRERCGSRTTSAKKTGSWRT